MSVEIVDYVKPEKVRAENHHDETIAAVRAAGNDVAVKLSFETAKDFRREVRLLREAAAHAGMSVRAVSPVAADATEGAFVIREKITEAPEAGE